MKSDKQPDTQAPAKPEPNRSNGGTFLRDANGVLIEHIPCTRPAGSTRDKAHAARLNRHRDREESAR